MTVHVFPPNDPPSRATKFAAELDKKLPTLPGDKSRYTFLLALLHNWELRYRHFLERLAHDREFDPGDVSAMDYAMTISEISIRLARYEARQ